MAVTEAEVIEALRPVEDPELHRSIVDLGMVREITITDGHVGVLVALTIAGCPLRAEIDNRVCTAVEALDGVTTSTLEFTVMFQSRSRYPRWPVPVCDRPGRVAAARRRGQGCCEHQQWRGGSETMAHTKRYPAWLRPPSGTLIR